MTVVTDDLFVGHVGPAGDWDVQEYLRAGRSGLVPGSIQSGGHCSWGKT